MLHRLERFLEELQSFLQFKREPICKKTFFLSAFGPECLKNVQYQEILYPNQEYEN